MEKMAAVNVISAPKPMAILKLKIRRTMKTTVATIAIIPSAFSTGDLSFLYIVGSYQEKGCAGGIAGKRGLAI